MIPNGRAEMRVCAMLFAALLLLGGALSESREDDAVIVRDSDINASWYTGRGIRPVGRFGRKVARKNEHLGSITAKVYRATADGSVWITQ